MRESFQTCFEPTIQILNPTVSIHTWTRIPMATCETAYIKKKLCHGTPKSVSSNYTPETNFKLRRPKLQLEIHCTICQILTTLSSPIYAFSNWNKIYSNIQAMNKTGIRYLPTKMNWNFRRSQIEFISDEDHAFVTTKYGHIGFWTLLTKPKNDLRSY